MQVRTFGNQLHELEHLLGVLADEASSLLHRVHDASAFARRRNVPNKLRVLGAAIDFDQVDYDRARAIGRIQRRLRQSGSGASAPSISHAGVCQPDARPSERPANAPFPLSSQAILSISDFYREVGERLVAQVLQRRPSLTFAA